MSGCSIAVAWSFWSRVRGLLGSPCPAAGHGLLIPSCRKVHTLGMRYPIDVIFLDAQMRVVSVHANVPPGRLRVADRRASHTLEVRSGGATECGLLPGRALRVLLHAPER